jgi:hypothetical protein
MPCALAALCLYALFGPKQAIKALSLGYLVLFLNPAFHRVPDELSTLRWIIILVAGLRVLPTLPQRSFRFLLPLLLFFSMVTVLSLATSENFPISFLKIFIFTFFAATVLLAFSSFDRFDLDEMRTWFLTIAVVVVLLSVPTFVFPKVGFCMNGTGFQGIMKHPQALGIFLAPVAAYMGACLLLRSCPQTPMVWGSWGIIMVVMILTRARTALVAFFLSLGVSLFIGMISSRRQFLKPAPSRALISAALISIVVGAALITSPALFKSVEGFMLKGEKGSIRDSFYLSRGAGIFFYWHRFLEAPVTGHGFGIDPANESVKNTNTFLGIPVSSSTEYGFLPAAFMAQVGLLGLAFFLPFFAVLVKGALHQVDIGLVAMFFACIFVNIGEAVFFSPGLDGGYQWLLIGLSTALSWGPPESGGEDEWTGYQEDFEGSSKCTLKRIYS